MVCFTAFLLSAVSVGSVSLDSDGYYHIVIAINEKTAQNTNENYIDNVKVSVPISISRNKYLAKNLLRRKENYFQKM